MKPPPKCRVCLDTAIVKRDGSPTVLTGKWSPIAELLAGSKPCPFCRAGEALAPTWAHWEAEWGKPLIERSSRAYSA